MIQAIIACLAADDWLIGDEDIDVAKGKYEMPYTFSELKTNAKRWQKRSNTYMK